MPSPTYLHIESHLTSLSESLPQNNTDVNIRSTLIIIEEQAIVVRVKVEGDDDDGTSSI
jgi:hypothetical protein